MRNFPVRLNLVASEIKIFKWFDRIRGSVIEIPQVKLKNRFSKVELVHYNKPGIVIT